MPKYATENKHQTCNMYRNLQGNTSNNIHICIFINMQIYAWPYTVIRLLCWYMQYKIYAKICNYTYAKIIEKLFKNCAKIWLSPRILILRKKCKKMQKYANHVSMKMYMQNMQQSEYQCSPHWVSPHSSLQLRRFLRVVVTEIEKKKGVLEEKLFLWGKSETKNAGK